MPQSTHPSPTSFLLDEENRQLTLTWTDEHESVHSWEALRWACPCAWCSGEGGQPGMLQSKQSLSVEETTLIDVQPVGRYGLECDECLKKSRKGL